MKIKFNKNMYLYNSTLNTCIGTDMPPTAELCLPKDQDGSVQYYNGAVPNCINPMLAIRVPAGMAIDIKDKGYSYNSQTKELAFRAQQVIGPNYSLCFPDGIDVTCYFAEDVSNVDFEIVE